MLRRGEGWTTSASSAPATARPSVEDAGARRRAAGRLPRRQPGRAGPARRVLRSWSTSAPATGSSSTSGPRPGSTPTRCSSTSAAASPTSPTAPASCPTTTHLYVQFGRSAVRHLFRVTSALDSMMVGEAQIAGQAKEAHERAHAAGLLGGILDQTFHEAFHLAKRIRTETELARRPVSLVTLVERTLHDHLAATSTPVLILGAGEMAAPDAAPDPHRRPAPAGDRRQSDARAGPRPWCAGDPAAGAPAPRLDPAPTRPGSALVVAATSSERRFSSRAARGRDPRPAAGRREPLLLVDLGHAAQRRPGGRRASPGSRCTASRRCAPRPSATASSGWPRWTAARRWSSTSSTILRRRLLDRALSPVARGLHESFREVAERALRHALTKDLAHLDEADRAAVEQDGPGSMIKRLVQVPLRGLQGRGLEPLQRGHRQLHPRPRGRPEACGDLAGGAAQ